MFTVVIGVDNELQKWELETEREVKVLIGELHQEGTCDILVFPAKPMKLNVTHILELS